MINSGEKPPTCKLSKQWLFHRFFYVNHDFPSFFHGFFYVSRVSGHSRPGAIGLSGSTPQSPRETAAGHGFLEPPRPDVLEQPGDAEALLGVDGLRSVEVTSC